MTTYARLVNTESSTVDGNGICDERVLRRSWTAWLRLPRRVGRALVNLYRLTLSPLIGFHCRYLPTCSDYADQALERHGLWAGGWMTVARLLRCHPWGNDGLDFVPECPAGRDARWYLPWR